MKKFCVKLTHTSCKIYIFLKKTEGWSNFTYRIDVRT